MPLDNERIKALLEKKKAPRVRGGKPKFDPDDRSYQAWFKMEHHLIDHDTNDMIFCDNPNCIDPRSREHGQVVVTVDGRNLCRYCFVDGWLITNAEQQVIS